MKVIEFVENVMGIELFDCQKKILESLERLPKNGHVVITRGSRTQVVIEKKDEVKKVS